MAAVYPELFSHFNQFTEPQIIELHRILTDYVSQLSLTLQQRDDRDRLNTVRHSPSGQRHSSRAVAS
jgi:hypothetical protein